MFTSSAIDTQRAHLSAQLSRNSASEIAESPSKLREAALEKFRRRNAALDAIFYDVGKITPEEAGAIAPWLAREGALLIVSPSANKSLRLYTDVESFADDGGQDLRVLAVSGVGSSALGSAAYARNVADAVGEPVAALVSGYGLSDLLTEASGGWFWFGALNSMRHGFEVLDKQLHFAANDSDLATRVAINTPLNQARTSLDTRVLTRLLADRRFDFRLLTGHSKGNLVISEALYNLGGAGPLDAHRRRTVVTLSATVTMPAYLKKVVNVMGGWDWLGSLNSRPSLQLERHHPRAWHHTNTAVPWHLPVTAVFEELFASGEISLD